MQPIFSIQISTKDRIDDLRQTLSSLQALIGRKDVECVVYDDGSSDGTADFLRDCFPQIKLRRNEESKGYLFCRNAMLNETSAEIAITLDDDANFLSDNPLEETKRWFDNHPDCGLIAFRIFWGIEPPKSTISNEEPEIVRGFVGCGHAWKMSVWRSVSDYPEWFEFYGEETFASLELFRNNLKIFYLPSVLVHHRVDMKKRRVQSGFEVRYRRSLRADWYLYFLFYPWGLAPRLFAYSLALQISKFFRNPRLMKPVFLAVVDFFKYWPIIVEQRKPFTKSQVKSYLKLPSVRVYWNP